MLDHLCNSLARGGTIQGLGGGMGQQLVGLQARQRGLDPAGRELFEIQVAISQVDHAAGAKAGRYFIFAIAAAASPAFRSIQSIRLTVDSRKIHAAQRLPKSVDNGRDKQNDDEDKHDVAGG